MESIIKDALLERVIESDELFNFILSEVVVKLKLSVSFSLVNFLSSTPTIFKGKGE